MSLAECVKPMESIKGVSMSMMTLSNVRQLALGACALSLLAFTTTTAQANSKSICGADDRELSTEPRVGRVLQPGDPAGCTVTMISKGCAITAGHCVSTFGIVEFNTPVSVDGRIQNSKPEDIYKVDNTRVVSTDGGIGNDFAVIHLMANEITGQIPGDAQGHYNVAAEAPVVGDIVRITGYGADYSDKDKNFAQQTHTGPIAVISGSSLYHQVDTMGGNSGSSIILESTGEIIGIHTHGGCGGWGGDNGSTLIAGHAKLQEAIKSCLADTNDGI